MTPRKAAQPAAPTLEGTLSANIRSAREARTWSQEELAGKMSDLGFDNWSRMTVTTIERGSRRVTIEEWLGLAEVFRWAAFQFLVPQEGDSTEVAITPKFSMEDDVSFFAAIVDEEMLSKISRSATAAAWKIAFRTVGKEIVRGLQVASRTYRTLAEQNDAVVQSIVDNPQVWFVDDVPSKEKP
jgi:transcriptional regulator with XRE-family HTH domain